MGNGLWVECILGCVLVWVCVRETRERKGTDIFRYLAQLSVRKCLPTGGVFLIAVDVDGYPAGAALCHKLVVCGKDGLNARHGQGRVIIQHIIIHKECSRFIVPININCIV